MMKKDFCKYWLFSIIQSIRYCKDYPNRSFDNWGPSCPVNISEKMANFFLCKKMIRAYGSERNPKKYIIFKWIICIWYLPYFYSFWYFFYISGNIFVIAAIVLERNLQGVANYLILSLAVADLLVAVLVMPLAAVYEVSEMICFQILWKK